jgi:preprotein translocase subunit SecG
MMTFTLGEILIASLVIVVIVMLATHKAKGK